ncbi:hypothetical protein [Sphingomonas sp. 2SG]|uniref:hypothetical protein n=1 Tax=Sphingomonas sp. 2SG TaxID=2502201 RepID=UPI0010FA5B33|nr:hypothetical protein [Sphingomonas sp. 2SG]
MAKPFKPWSKARCERQRIRDAELRALSDRAIMAGVDAINAGEDVPAAIAAVTGQKLDADGNRVREDDFFEPLLHLRRQRVDGWSADTQRAFIGALADTGCVSHACKAVGVPRNSAYAMRQRATHSVFALAWDVAIQMGRKRLLDIAMERALEGQEVAIWYRGEQVGTRTVHNDRLLTFLLSHKPEPAHPRLAPHELAAMFPRLLDLIDVVQPHPAAQRLAADKAAAEAAEQEEDDDY